MGEREAGELRYRAFLSYSHKDAAAAGRLHRRLEAYLLPRRLAGSVTARGAVPQRLWPIFRDREELPAATDLSETVREALAQSGALIVLCSPHAARSLWVAEEIETFRRLHPDRPILAAVLDGDPPECFPTALRALGPDGALHEPLATDLRPHRDGPRLGLLKLVAGITGVALDALVQRDAQRKVRRVTAVTGLAAFTTLVMAALTWFALEARNEAERQRAEAEGQIEFMLTGLHTRLREVGRLDIMTTVNRHALDYYERQGVASLSPDSLERRARVLHALGEDDLARGNFPGALAAFQEAHRTTEEQLAREPNSPARIFSHGRSEYLVGRIHELRRDWPAAEGQYRRFAAAARRLIEAAPDNPDFMMEAGWAAVDIGNIHLNGTGDHRAAQRSYEGAMDWFRRAVRARPRNIQAWQALANAHAWLADSFFAQARWRQSLEQRLGQYRILELLRRVEPANTETAFLFALAQRGLSASYERLGDRRTALRHLIPAYRQAGELTRQDPGNADWLLAQAFAACQLNFGTLEAPSDIRASARADIVEAYERLEAAGNPRRVEFENCWRPLRGSRRRIVSNRRMR